MICNITFLFHFFTINSSVVLNEGLSFILICFQKAFYSISINDGLYASYSVLVTSSKSSEGFILKSTFTDLSTHLFNGVHLWVLYGEE